MKYSLQPTQLTIVFERDIVSTRTERLRQVLSAMFEDTQVASNRWNQLTLDFTHCRTIDSAGLNLLVSIIKKVKQRDVRIKALIQGHLKRVFSFTRLDQHLEIIAVDADPKAQVG